MKKIFWRSFFGVVFFVLFCASFCLAEEKRYYEVLLIFDAKENKLSLPTGEKLARMIGLSSFNYTFDTGSGSQFYAKLKKTSLNYALFDGSSDKYFLGNWKLIKFEDGIEENGDAFSTAEQLEKGEIIFSVPYFDDGQEIEIYDSKTDEMKMSLDVSRFSKQKNEGESLIIDNIDQPKQKSYFWFVLGGAGLILVLTILGWMWFRKRREMVIS